MVKFYFNDSTLSSIKFGLHYWTAIQSKFTKTNLWQDKYTSMKYLEIMKLLMSMILNSSIKLKEKCLLPFIKHKHNARVSNLVT